MYVASVHRTQIYLEPAQYQALQSRARREGKSMAALIRQILSEHLDGQHSGDDPLDRVIGIGEGDGSPVAENHKDYLYGRRK